MTGALATACFVKVYGSVFLGTARSSAAWNSNESSPVMIATMTILALLCGFIGFYPGITIPVLTALTKSKELATLFPFTAVSAFALILSTAIFISLMFIASRKTSRRKSRTWDCGYARPDQHMQYTASSFAQNSVTLFSSILRPMGKRPYLSQLFPQKAAMESHVNDLVLDRILRPLFRKLRLIFRWFYRFQQGESQRYILYIFTALLLLFLTRLPLKEIMASYF
jgi:formate hydrogenlyase subunit 3/multisubunit Na+/H+ antiporter MnhD subunit